ncbi:MAG: hypothetical protein EHM39_07950 [Chloroflexi bacterium]|nr:MAG: hypothetical protein EHM39_07950 [Chloroflexota bacterium]
MRRLNRRRRARREQWADELIAPESEPVPDEEPYDEYGDYDEAAIEPFVPVTSEDEEADYPDELETETAYPAHEPRRRLRLSRPEVHLPSPGIEGGYLLLALVLIGGGIFGALLNRGEVPPDIEEWWPVAVVVVAALWMLIALARRQVASLLGGAALAGVGLSLLMNNQDIADFEETLLGMVLVTAGLGIVIQGFLLRQHTPYG